MPWQCRMEEPGSVGMLKVGGMWFGEPCMIDPNDKYGEFCLKTFLSREYKRDWLGKRLPLFVVLPHGGHFCVDSAYSRTRGSTQEGWTVTGTAPNITVEPSINWEDQYHGFLINGVLSDDVQGRKFGESQEGNEHDHTS